MLIKYFKGLQAKTTFTTLDYKYVWLQVMCVYPCDETKSHIFFWIFNMQNSWLPHVTIKCEEPIHHSQFQKTVKCCCKCGADRHLYTNTKFQKKHMEQLIHA